MEYDPVRLIEEVKQHPGLYSSECPADREEKLLLWKKVGAAMFSDWTTINKATAYDRVLQLQKKWRSIRDAYNRELRGRRSGQRSHRKTYRYFKQLTFLGGFDEGATEDSDSNVKEENSESDKEEPVEKPITKPVKKAARKNRKRKASFDSYPTEEVEMPAYTTEERADNIDSDSDKLFLLSFLPEMRQLPVDIKMWVRSQIANTMQEAVSNQYNKRFCDIKNPRHDSSTD